MSDECLRQEIKRYKDTFGTPYTWMAEKFKIDKSVFNYFVNEIDRKISERSMQLIRDGFKTLPKNFK